MIRIIIIVIIIIALVIITIIVITILVIIVVIIIIITIARGLRAPALDQARLETTAAPGGAAVLYM